MAASSPATRKKKTAAKKVATARTWKRSSAEELELPSGNVALVKRPGMMEFIRSGVVPDSLLPIINDQIAKGRGRPPTQSDFVKDVDSLDDMMEMVDRVLVLVVQEPAVELHWTEEEVDGKKKKTVIPLSERSEDVLYTDDVDLDDKMFIFQFASGGTRDAERFREESGAGVGGVSSREADGGTPE